MGMTAVWAHRIISVLFFLCYAYQFVFLAVPAIARRRAARARRGDDRENEAARDIQPTACPAVWRHFCVLIAARNEEKVIGQLLDSLSAQDYPAEMLSVCVIADNCSDATAAIAREHGASVLERRDHLRVGKGYALQYALRELMREAPEIPEYDAYLVLDADNLLAPGYVTAMNAALDRGQDIVTGYRNSKNYGDNWISAGYGLWFLRDCQQLNRARAALGLSCVVSGTGFAFTRRIVEREGWQYCCLTEDTEFTAAQICAGERIGYCEEAVLYDEQPTRFSQSWRQRMRWAKGYFQVLGKYGKRLLRGMLHGDFSCFDLVAGILPAFVLSVATLAVDITDAILRVAAGGSPLPAFAALGSSALGAYLTLLVLGGVTLCTEWKRIRIPAPRKVGLYLLFPLFMLTYVPVSIAALFRSVEWKPITHDRALTLEQLGID